MTRLTKTWCSILRARQALHRKIRTHLPLIPRMCTHPTREYVDSCVSDLNWTDMKFAAAFILFLFPSMMFSQSNNESADKHALEKAEIRRVAEPRPLIVF